MRFIPTCMGNSGMLVSWTCRVAVHPHVHGELLGVAAGGAAAIGSSPRAWGTRVLVQHHRLQFRFIPTCMGNSSSAGRRVRGRSVHPHVHGELTKVPPSGKQASGSSPRAWGTRLGNWPGRAPARFIPTCMGNSCSARTNGSTPPVHPHVHGELPFGVAGYEQSFGSSPRAWGTLSLVHYSLILIRFIPTCMGNSLVLAVQFRSYSVHPHVHGELSWFITHMRQNTGSSPRAWGTPLTDYKNVCASRFIPTCMGNSTACISTSPGSAVHPHVHGELFDALDYRMPAVGSSPRAWGTRLDDDRDNLVVRFIPTCMGNSARSRRFRPGWTVHPHVHGELRTAASSGRSSVGSSPRAWGTRWRGDHWPWLGRFIPTCMGNSQRQMGQAGRLTVHPHVHGELRGGPHMNLGQAGSSPRAWGTHLYPTVCSPTNRFIPTCMGNSTARSSRTPSLPVHPHVHGELRFVATGGTSSIGSSPRAWGTHLIHPRPDRRPRFIPTCMGNSTRKPGGGAGLPVHPHVHGELHWICDR
mgnify:CR=1 FL=1